MSILVDRAHAALVVQGITGREGGFHAAQMHAYGTNDRGRHDARQGRPARPRRSRPGLRHGGPGGRARPAPTRAVIYVPAAGAPDAILEAVDAGIRTIFCITEHIPALDMLKVVAEVRAAGAHGSSDPTAPARRSPGKAKVGIIPGSIHRPGRVGLVSRSGTLTYEVVQALTDAGIGQSTCVGIGGDPIAGTDFVDILTLFQRRPRRPTRSCSSARSAAMPRRRAAAYRSGAPARHARWSPSSPAARRRRDAAWATRAPSSAAGRHRRGQDRRAGGGRHPRRRLAHPDPATAHGGRHPARLTSVSSPGTATPGRPAPRSARRARRGSSAGAGTRRGPRRRAAGRSR